MKEIKDKILCYIIVKIPHLPEYDLYKVLGVYHQVLEYRFLKDFIKSNYDTN